MTTTAAEHAAKLEDNLCFLGEFGTWIDYALDDAGNLAFEYGVRLSEVSKKIREHEEDMAYYYESLGREASR